MDPDNDPITVFHVRNSDYAGGIETTLFGWFKYADSKNLRPRLFLFRERRQLHRRSVEILEEQGIRCELLPWGYLRNLPGAVYRLWREVAATSKPVLHSHDTRADLVALIVARLTGAPLIISNHAWHPADRGGPCVDIGIDAGRWRHLSPRHFADRRWYAWPWTRFTH